MAIAIKSIPVLNKEVAENFANKIEKNSANKSSIDFSKQSAITSKILAKAKI